MGNSKIELDGSVGEGGGQILRTALALSMVSGRPLVMHRIRAKRSKPGLMRQHLACVQAAQAVCAGKAEGAELGSQDLAFTPGAIRAGEYEFRIGTAGSCTLVIQTVLPALMLAQGPSTVTVSGGTHNPLAPPFHFLERSFAPLLRRAGVGIELELGRLGFYPAGGGQVTMRVHPAQGELLPVDVTERGALLDEFAECLTPGLPSRVAVRELEVVGKAFGWTREQLRMPAARQNEGPGNALMITLRFEHITEVVTAFGEKGVAAERVADMAVREAQAYRSGRGALGPHLADQWMLPMALAVAHHGRASSFTCTELTEHARTNMETISAFLPVQFDVTEADGLHLVRTLPTAQRHDQLPTG